MKYTVKELIELLENEDWSVVSIMIDNNEIELVYDHKYKGINYDLLRQFNYYKRNLPKS